jgi:LPS sulfotransferase NodH
MQTRYPIRHTARHIRKRRVGRAAAREPGPRRRDAFIDQEIRVVSGFASKKMEHHYVNSLPCLSKAFPVQYGEKVDDYFFSPLRKHIFVEQGVKRWYAPLLAARPRDGRGFAAINLGESDALHETVLIPPGNALLVAHAFETMAVRIHVPSPGTYFVAAQFVPVQFEGDYVVSVCANGKRMWDGRIGRSSRDVGHAVFLQLSEPGFVDFAINAEKAGQTVPCRALVRYALVRCDAATGALQLRCDDRAAALDEQALVEAHAGTPYRPVALAAPHVDIDARVAVFEREWTLPIEYIGSQYQRTPREFVELVLRNQGAAARKYCIFMIPRSGSTLLTELLSSTNQLGFPGESFVPDVLRTLSLTFSDLYSDFESFLPSRLRTENGVFGIEIESERLLEEPEFFADVHGWRHVYIWRENILAQAISYRISIETGIWHNFSGVSQDEKFIYISRKAIIDKVNFLLGAEQFFKRYFAENGLSPYTISYESLVADPEGHARRIGRYITGDDEALTFPRQDKVVLQRTAKARNAYYVALAIGGEGELWGYDIHESAEQCLAVLHGVDLGVLDLSTERAPVLFLAKDRQTLCDRVNRYVTGHLASLQPLANDA